MAETFSTFQLKPGDPAPDFALPDPDGASHALESLRGERGTLVVFACNHCPYVVHIADELGKLAAEIAGRGVATVAISSNDIDKYPDDRPELMAKFADLHGWDFPYLHDEDQSVAKAYGAACTPDLFLFDGEGELYYAGQFDETRPKDGKLATGADLRAAVDQMLDHGPPPPDPRPASGCNIKWKPGNEPDYFG